MRPPRAAGRRQGTQATAALPARWAFPPSRPATCCARRWPTGTRARPARCRGSWLPARLVDDATMADVVRDRLAKPDARRGFLLDGFPRTLAAGRDAGRDPPRRRPGARRRAAGGRAGGRAGPPGAAARAARDDQEEVIRERLRVYREKTAPLIGYYRERGLLREIDGNRPVEEVTAGMLGLFGGRGSARSIESPGLIDGRGAQDPGRDRADGPGEPDRPPGAGRGGRADGAGRHDARARPSRRARHPRRRRGPGLPELPGLSGDAVHLGQRRHRARHPGRRPAPGRGHRRDRLRRLLQGVLRRRGADLRRRQGQRRGRDGCCASPRRPCGWGSRRCGRAGGSRTSARRSSATPRATASRWCGSSRGTASGPRCTRTRRCPTSARRARARSCKPGMVLAIEPMVNAGAPRREDGPRRLDGAHRGRVAVGPLRVLGGGDPVGCPGVGHGPTI